MHINELDSFKLSDAVSFHDNLNPKLWRNQDLRPEVKNQLMIIARDFLEELGIKDIDVKDITISGSNAAYSYTKHSDLDLHILLDMTDYANNEVYQEFFNAKKTLYNDSHNITLHGIPVELYVQDMNQPVRSLGEYSLLQDKWLKIPSKRRANFDQTATKAKYDKLLDFINLALKLKDTEKLNTLLKKIRQYRQSGLDKGGEFGPENLAYKALRSQGYITKLYDLRDKLHSEKLSIESMYQEDYDPNGPPPGPEFKPTMPKGTVRVDVSDVYDWYKLGQHISNMKGLGKHDFGKGPPSTIMAFGDEDLEHQYIQALKKTGLSTTDIDPASHKKIKGQKVDPTFNVNEETGKKSAIYSTDVYGMTAYHSKCLEPGCDWESKRYDSIKLAQNAAQKHAQKHFKKGVAEGFDQPYKLKWETGDHGDVDAYTQLPDGNYLSIMFNKEHNQDNEEAWSVEFYRNNSQEVTGEGDAQRVFATVLGAIQTFIKKYKPNRIIFSASKEVEPGQNAQSRANLYDRLVQRYAKSWGFKAFRADTGNKVIYELNRIKKEVEESASGYIPSNSEKDDPRFKTALTVDIKPDTMKKDAKKFGNKISRAGIPPTLKPSGKF
jgi:hypothetical protein